MGAPGLVRVCLKDKTRRVSGLARPWRVDALLAALEADPETVPELLVAAQRFMSGHPFATVTYDGWLGSLRRVQLDRRYTEGPGRLGRARFDLEARHVQMEGRGLTWRRSGWLYYHDGEAFTRRRVAYRIPESWRVEGVSEEHGPQTEWNEAGPEPFEPIVGSGS